MPLWKRATGFPMLCCRATKCVLLLSAVQTYELRAPCEVPGSFVKFQQNLDFLNIFVKVPNIKFKENPSGGNLADTCGRT